MSNIETWNAMKNTERNAWIAENVCGFTRHTAMRRGERMVVIVKDKQNLYSAFTRSQSDPGGWEPAPGEPLTPGGDQYLPDFMKSPVAVYQMETAIAERGEAAMRAYVLQLANLVTGEAVWRDVSVTRLRAFKIAHASPAQRAAAAYLAFAGKGGA